MKNKLKRLLRRIRCRWLHDHDWTCAAEQGLKPTEGQMHTIMGGSLAGFYDYAEMFCRDCGRVSEISREWQRDAAAREAQL